MATFNSAAATADLLNNAAAAAASLVAADHYERTGTTFLVPTSNATLQLEPFHIGNTTTAAVTNNPHSSTSSSYTFVQIKRELPEVTTSNNHHQQHHHQHMTTTQQQQQQHSSSMSSSTSSLTSSSSKTMSSSTLTTLVKIEASSPKVQELDKSSLTAPPPISNTNNSVPIGIAVARKRPQESLSSLGNASIPVQQTLNKDMNCFGIRVADIGGVSSGCGNIYFTGNGDLMTGSATAEELALSAAGMQSVNRAPSTFWQYPSAVPIESVISMSPATVGLQYQRDASRGQVVLLPASAAALGISNFPLYTPTDPFQQAAAAFVWPSYIPQGTTTAALQTPPNFIFPSMSPHSSLQPQPYATPLQLFGSNYLTAAAAAFCQHNQQTNSSTSTINLGLGSTTTGNSSATSSRYLSMSATESKRLQDTTLSKQHHPQSQQHLLPPPTMKIEEWNAAEYMSAAAKTTSTTLSATTHQNHHMGTPTTTLTFDRDKTTNLLELQGNTPQALNLMRLPTPPTSASIETAPNPPQQHQQQMQSQILFQANPSPTLLNLSATGSTVLPRLGSAGTAAPANMTTNFLNNVGTTTTLTATIGPPTPLNDDSLNCKTSALDAAQQQIVVGVPRVAPSIGPPPQMQDVNIQTDTPVCSEDESSSCPLAAAAAIQNNIPSTDFVTATPPPSEMEAHKAGQPAEQPLELTTTGSAEKELSDQCHKDELVDKEENENERGANEMNSSQNDDKASLSLFQVLGGKSTPAIYTDSAEGVTAITEPVTTEPVSILPPQKAPEDLTGLELLSNISTSSLAKNSIALNVKLEPIDHTEYNNCYLEAQREHTLPLEAQNSFQHHPPNTIENSCVPLLPTIPATEPLGGLNLLCALAEQRIQEEVQSSGNLFGTMTNNIEDDNEDDGDDDNDDASCLQHQQQQMNFAQQNTFGLNHIMEHAADGSMELTEESPALNEVKRKKHKHSKSSKSGKKSQHNSKKMKKKYAKEKHKLKQKLEQPEFDDEDDVQEDLKSAFNKVDTSYKRFGNWPNPEEIFKAMESDMRMRLADITRQYRKKKRKLDEISKNKRNKKKAAKNATSQIIGLCGATASNTLSGIGNINISAHTGSSTSSHLTSSPLCDYKFSKILSASKSSTTAGSYLSPSNFLRFNDSKSQMQPQFPPAIAATTDVDQTNVNEPPCSSSSLYKPLRLEPSSLGDSSIIKSTMPPTAMRPQKHCSSEKTTQLIGCKERKLMASRLSMPNTDTMETTTSTSTTTTSVTAKQLQQQQDQRSRQNSIDRELVLTSEHLYRKETRVLTDMGGLFYAGILKPLQPPDVYAITLDGERGNKSHIMSREEIFKDTILEVAPNSIESVPVGTRLCAYWSQQYRCLYPGKAIETENSDDGTTNDFVSVEFDDGDSGRIRLQNIRFLLSDYPIVEYDNPLCSLGKQKKSILKSGTIFDHTSQHHESSSQDDHQHLLKINTELQQKSMDLFAQRSEKKRIKSLKKKSLANNGGIGGNISDPNEHMRKHHKHKKRKKHKKHHHRKAALQDAESIGFGVDAAATIYANSNKQDNFVVEVSERESNVCESAGLLLHRTADNARVSNVKMESSQITQTVSAATETVNVKTENLDLEEETTSNMMSEVSDEAKGDDEVEHNNSKGSKIAAFLPERQLWGWLGKAYRKAGVKGRARKQFYKTIKRGKETITVGDCAVFLSTGRPDRPYIGRIESMWETASSNKVVRVRWFYHPEETTGCPNLKYPGALFESPHEDENDVQTISHRCAVLPFERYFEKFGADSKQYQSIYDNNDTYYLSGYYNPRLQVLKLEDDIPTLEEKNTTDN